MQLDTRLTEGNNRRKTASAGLSDSAGRGKEKVIERERGGGMGLQASKHEVLVLYIRTLYIQFRYHTLLRERGKLKKSTKKKKIYYVLVVACEGHVSTVAGSIAQRGVMDGWRKCFTGNFLFPLAIMCRGFPVPYSRCREFCRSRISTTMRKICTRPQLKHPTAVGAQGLRITINSIGIKLSDGRVGGLSWIPLHKRKRILSRQPRAFSLR